MRPLVLLAVVLLAVLALAGSAHGAGSCKTIRNPQRGQIGQIKQNMRTCKTAVSKLTKKKRLKSSKYHATWARLAESLEKLGVRGTNPEEGPIRLWEKAIAVDNNHNAYTELGVLLHRAGRIEESAATHLKGIEYAPESYWLPYPNLALEYQTLGKVDLAVQAYRDGIARGMPFDGRRLLAMATMLPFNYESAEDFDYWRQRFRANLVHIWKHEGDMHMSNPFAQVTYRNAPGYYQVRLRPLATTARRGGARRG